MSAIENEFNALDPIHRQIDITLEKLNIIAEKLDDTDTDRIIRKFVCKYCNNEVKHYLWEGICKAANDATLECIAVSNDDAWRWINQFISGKAIIFFNREDEKVSYAFDDGKSIVDVLEECYNFEFYITNANLDYALGYSHHRVLYACGTATKWLKKYKTPAYDFFSK